MGNLMLGFARQFLIGAAFLTLLPVVPTLGQTSTQESSPEATLLFETSIKPLFENNCKVCHSDQAPSSGLSVGNRAALLAGGNRGPAVLPGRPEGSLLLQAVRHEGQLKMPPGSKLPDEAIAALTRWVDLGAPWDKSVPPGVPHTASKHWAFQPIRHSPEPQMRNTPFTLNGIDYFILARLEEEGLTPSPEADRATLIRRLSLDLLGLAPCPTEVEEFLGDTRPDAYGRLVDKLLESPHYGERWGRHWLDLARYADSNGYNIDGPRDIWLYRDWVINALNQDLPFDQFVIEQVAGDLLPNASKQQIIATGFHRNTLLNLEGGVDFEQYRVEAVADRVSTTGSALLGLTLGCARCHDHKYDPISQREFYQIYAFFNNIDELSGEHGEEKRETADEPILELGTPDQLARREVLRAQRALLQSELEQYEKKLLTRQPEWEETLSEEERTKLKPEDVEILAIPPEKRNDFQKKSLENAFKATDLGYTTRQSGLEALGKLEPEIPRSMVMQELSQPRETYIHLGGDFLRKGVPVTPGIPSVFPPLPPKQNPTRLDLARWLVDPQNPLTPRVIVNRIWQRYFGVGLVETENDFGAQGSPPTHPELLDWLASELMARDWSLKTIHRLIVGSGTYRQSSRGRDDLAAVDPRNRLLGRQNRLRLEAEIVRDVGLSVSGLLNRKIGGPSVFPPQPKGAGRVTQVDRKWTAATGANRYRRGLYTYFWRSSPHPGLMVFDAPDSTTSCSKRNRSNTPLQALTLLNDEAFYEFAQGLAARILKEGPADHSKRLGYAFRVGLGREPKPKEQERMENFLVGQREDFMRNPREAATALSLELPPETDLVEMAAWTAVSRVLLNLDEFITRE